MLLQPGLSASSPENGAETHQPPVDPDARPGLDAWTRYFLDFRDPGSGFLHVPRPRMLIIEGLPGRDRIALAQAVGLQYEAHGIDARCPAATEKGHPLRRSWDSNGYDDANSFAHTLVHQWENFAIRAEADAVPWICAGVWLDAPRTLAAEGMLDVAGAAALAAELFDALAPLEPCLVYLGGRDSDEVGDAAFAGLQAHRTLLNGARLTATERVDEVLAVLGMSRREISLAPNLATRIAGRYGGQAQQLVLQPTADTLTLTGLPAELGRSRPLLPAPNGRFVVAGVDLELRVDLDNKGAARGLLVDASEPALADWPVFLEWEAS